MKKKLLVAITCMLLSTMATMAKAYQADVRESKSMVAVNDVDLDRTNWTVTTQTATGYNYVPDGTTGLPEHILDGSTTTFLSLVKPGKSYSPVPAQPSNFIPSFTIDMQSGQTFNYIKWRHRSSNNYKYLHVYGVDVEISNDGTNFTKINNDIVWIPNISGYTGSVETTDANTYKIDIPESTGRYVRIKFVMWSDIYSSQHPDYPGTGPGSGSTMQVAEFGLGKTELPAGVIKHNVIVNLGEGIANVTPYFARVDDGDEFTAIFKLKPDYTNPVVTGGAFIEENKIRVANVTSDMNLSLSAIQGQINITTPYPSIIEIAQINSAEKERIRLRQGHKKYDRQPTGFYVETGKKIEVNVEILTAADQNTMPVLTVGTMGFNVDGRNTGTQYLLKTGVNTITASSDGLIWLSFLQEGSAEPIGRARITFTENSEHIRAPRYVFGITPHAEFGRMMSAYQTPDVLYQSDYIVAVATRAAALQYSIDENKDEWMMAIHTLLAKEDEISGMDNSDSNPVHHRLKVGEVRFLLVENTSTSPHANSAGYTGYPNGSRSRYLTKLGMPGNNSWMLGHELGHQHQQPAYMINMATESTVNIYSYVVERNIQGAGYNRTAAGRWTQAQNTYLKLPFSKRIYDMNDGLLESIIGFNRDELRFMVWEQLFLIFGDDFYKTLHRVVREEKNTGGVPDERRAYLIWKASQISGYDLTEFFNLWGIRVTDSEIKAKLRARIANAKTKGEILDLESISRTAEELIMVTGQNHPSWIPVTLRGIISSRPENENFPIDRTNWTINTSIEGVPDGTVGGDDPIYIIDGNTTSAFAFIKPGKTYEGITGPADYIPLFTIDMQSEQTFNYVSYLHRSTGNTSEFIRARQFSVYGSNDNSIFIPVKEHYMIDYVKNNNEIIVEFPAVSYRYIRVVIEDWNQSSGSTVQIAEFNAGTKSPEEQLPVPNPLKFKVNIETTSGIITSQAGVHLVDEDSNYTVNFTLSPDVEKLIVTVDGDTVAPVVNNSVYSLTVKVTNHLEIGISAETITGLMLPNGEGGINVYPNPVKAKQPFMIKTDGKFSDRELNIYTLWGVKVYNRKISNDLIEQTINQRGIYIIEIKNDEEKYMSKIIIK